MQIIDSMDQGSPAWLQARIGCVTMSNAKKITAGGEGLTRDTYLAEVASEIITGVPAERYNSWDMLRGTMLEPFALRAVETVLDESIRRVGLVYLDERRRISASPDGLIMATPTEIEVGVEVKCQCPKKHMLTILAEKNPAQFEMQLQGSMWVCGTARWLYVSFCPEFKERPLVILSAERDEAMICKISMAAEEGVAEVDRLVAAARREINPAVEAIRVEALEELAFFADQNSEPEFE